MRTTLVTLHSKFIHSSLALPCLATYCGSDCGEILIREFTIHEPRYSIIASLLADDPDNIAFSVYLWNRQETLDLVDALFAVRPQIKVILGGPEVSFSGTELLDEHPGIKALVTGEGEIPFRKLLASWKSRESLVAIERTIIRHGESFLVGPDSEPLTQLDDIPSPFDQGLVDLARGFVYYETSRGCPFRCSFCLSARDRHVRSFSLQRIENDLLFLMQQQVPKVKLVDRTFNYDPQRSYKIFDFILNHNISTHFHFEIAAHLLDQRTLDLLETVPSNMFQFEIGIQTTQESTLNQINRAIDFNKLEHNLRWLTQRCRIELHLDLVAGLPGDNFNTFMDSIDKVVRLKPDHLQIELVKLLPGSPLRDQVEELKIHYDPNPPYMILSSPGFSYSDLTKIHEVSRLIDIIFNTGYFATFLGTLSRMHNSLAQAFLWLADSWAQRNLFRYPLNRQTIFIHLHEIVRDAVTTDQLPFLIDSLAYDYARCERVVPKRVPEFFDTALNDDELDWVQREVQKRTHQIRGEGIKVQYFAAVFSNLDSTQKRTPCLFFYLTQSGKEMRVEERRFCPDESGYPVFTDREIPFHSASE